MAPGVHREKVLSIMPVARVYTSEDNGSQLIRNWCSDLTRQIFYRESIVELPSTNLFLLEVSPQSCRLFSKKKRNAKPS